MIYLLPEHLSRNLTAIKYVKSKASYRRLAWYLAGLFLICAIALTLVPWQQTASGFGRVVAYSPTDRVQNIDAPVEGRIGTWFVHEGTIVKEGDPIVEIQDNDPEIMRRLVAERQAVQRRLEVSRVATKTSKINLDRQRDLFNHGLSARRAYEQAELEYARYLTDEANASAELSRIEVRLARQSVQSVKAPRSGTILRRMSGQGSDLVKPGDVLAVIVPDTESRAVEIWIDGNDAPLVHPEQHVRLQFEGWPAVQFSGWPSVAAGTFGAEVAFVDPADNGQGKFRVVIVPTKGESWPSSRYLRQGVRANAWISLSKVRLGYELWRQFNGFPPSLTEEKVPQGGAVEKKS
jgi:multidrug efflux pump subunit AcrA (membrane-fusion protein)